MTGDRHTGTAKAAFRLAFAGYVGTLVAGLVAIATTLTEPTRIAVTGAAAVGLLGGALVGIVLARRHRELPTHLGRSRLRRTALPVSATPFGVAVGAALLGWLELRIVVAALGVAVAVTGYVVMRLAETCYVDSLTDDKPAATWQWEPPGTPKLDAIVLATWLLLGAVNAVTADWLLSITWTGLALFWAATSLAEGRWRVGSLGDAPELRVHEAGLVEQRPYTRSLVRWSEISHVRLREDELVLDRGLFDVRFGRDQLADLEAARTEIERHRQSLGNGAPGTP
ncbi:hypothetical protein HYG81_10350 [Natrinema zhouii]|uniref:PH domain-containing protein n=1 Tax=Natrinema zhouii TaxID=1710539 RepID=A0A7D6GTI7_9EURY|nr:hypothetical protein [Natrinema zhouii]QLK24526.1 hypothetical protein HYG81_10350 [Natrinema zhouii]